MYGVTQMTVTENTALVSLKKIPHKLDLFADVFGRFAQKGINIVMISQTSPLGGNVSVSFTCPDNDMVSLLSVTKNLQETDPTLRPLVSSGNAKIQLSGEEMRTSGGVFARAMSGLANAHVEVLQVSTSEVDICLLVPATSLDAAYTALKEAFAL